MAEGAHGRSRQGAVRPQRAEKDATHVLSAARSSALRIAPYFPRKFVSTTRALTLAPEQVVKHRNESMTAKIAVPRDSLTASPDDGSREKARVGPGRGLPHSLTPPTRIQYSSEIEYPCQYSCSLPEIPHLLYFSKAFR